MSALDAFPSERRPLGYSDAYSVELTERYRVTAKMMPEPWSGGGGWFGFTSVDAVERALTLVRWQATMSHKLHAWRILAASDGIGRYGSTMTAPKETR